jgi:hypothetical protein
MFGANRPTLLAEHQPTSAFQLPGIPAFLPPRG